MKKNYPMRKLSMLLGFLLFLSINGFAQSLSEDFEGSFPPTGWTLQSASSDVAPWTVSSSEFQSGTQSAQANNGGSGTYTNEWLISPSISISSGDILTFYRYFNSGSASWPDTMEVLISNNGMTSWNQLAIYTPDTASDAGFVPRSYDLSTFTGSNCHVAFRYASAWGYSSYIDDVTIQPAPSCTAPTNLSASSITTTSADLSWTTGGASNWNIEYGLAGFTQGSGTVVMNVSNPYSLSGLTANESYDFYVQDSCGVGDVSSWAGPYSFTTNTPTISSFPYINDFESGSAGNYIAFTTASQSDLTVYSSAAEGGSSYGLHFEGGSTAGWTGGSSSATESNAWNDNTDHHATAKMILDLTSVSSPVMFFDLAQGYEYGNKYVWFRVVVNGTPVADINGTINHNPQSADDPFHYLAYNLSSYAGQNNVIVELQSSIKYSYPSDNDYTFVDNIYIDNISCMLPTNLNASNITSNSADLSWTTGGASNWNIEWGASGFTQGSGTIITDVSNPYTLSGLTANTTYDFYVQDSCGVGDVSIWAGPYTFTTLAPTLNLPFTDGFETDLSAWALAGSKTAVISTSEVLSGNSSVDLFNDNNNTTSEMIVSFNSANDPRLSLSYYIEYYMRNNFKVFIQEAGTSSWTEIHNWDTEYGSSSDDDIWISIVEMDLAAYDTESGVFKIKLWAENTYTSTYSDYNVWVDDFYIYEPSTNDLGVTQIIEPTSFIENSMANDVVIQLTNSGIASQSNIPVKYSIDGGVTIVTETFAGPIAPGDTITYTFNQKATLTNGINNCVAVVSNPGDTLNDNDTAFAEVYNYDLPYENNFEGEVEDEMPDGWTYINTASTSSYVEVYDGTLSYDGDKSLHFYETSTSGDLIAVMPAYHGGTLADKWLEMQVRGEDDSPLIIGVLTNPTDETTFIGVDTIIPPDGSYQNYIITFADYTGSGKYVGLKHGLETTYDDFYIDNLSLYQPSSNNLAIIDITAPNSGIDNGAQQDFVIRITNQGSAAQSNIPVKYSIDGGTTIITETFTGTINTFDTASFTFNQKVSLAAGLNYCAAVVNNPGDTINDNDTVFAQIHNYALPYYNDFENESTTDLPENWRYLETYSSAYAYAYSSSTYAYEGSYSLKMYNSGAGSSDDIIAILPEYRGNTITNKWLSMAVRGQDDSPLIIGVLDDPNDETTFTGVDTIVPPDETYDNYLIKLDSYTGSGKYIGLKHGCGTTYDYFYIDNLKLFEPKANDVAIINIETMEFAIDANTEQDVKVTLANLGTNSHSSVPLSYTIDGGTTVVQETYNTGTLNSLDTIVFTFNQKVIYPTGTSTLEVYSELSTDADNTNDSSFVEITNHPMPYTTDFEDDIDGEYAKGWTAFNNLSSSSAVANVENTSASHTGDQTLELYNANSSSGDLISIMPYYGGNLTDKWLEFYVRGDNDDDTLFVGVMTDPTDASTFAMVDTVYPPEDTYEIRNVSLSSYTGTGNYIAFKLALSTTYINLYIDDLLLDTEPTGPVYFTSHDSVDFNKIRNIFPDTAKQVVSIKNKGYGLLTISSLGLNSMNTANFSIIDTNTYPIDLAMHESISFEVSFQGSSAGLYTGKIDIVANSANKEIPLSGEIEDVVITSFPYVEDFESNGNIPGKWHNDQNDGGSEDWTFHTSDTNGPSEDATTGTGYYAMLDDFSITTSNNPVNLLTPPVDLSSTPNNIKMNYKAWIGSSAVANPIHIDISTDMGASWNEDILIHDKAITNSWQLFTLNFDTLANDTIIVRFRGVSGFGSGLCNSAIDDVAFGTDPVIELGNDTAICADADITFDPGFDTDWTYEWYVDTMDVVVATTQTITVDSAGKYYVKVTKTGGFNSVDSIILSIDPLPTITMTALADICENGSTFNLDNAAPTGGTYYGNGVAAATFDPDLAGVGTHYVKYAYTDGNNCSNIDSTSINVLPLTPIAITPMADLCVDAAPMALSFATPTGGTYYGPGVDGSGNFDPSVTGAGMHYLKYSYTAPNGCTSLDSVSVAIHALPVVSASATPNPVNYGTSASLNATVSGGSSYTYVWSPADSLGNPADVNLQNPTTKNLNKPTTFTVEVTDVATSCVNTASANVGITGGPLSATPVAYRNTVCAGDTTHLQAQAAGGSESYTYSWTSTPAGFTSTDANPEVTVNSTTTYHVTVDDGFNTATASVTVSTWDIPTVTAAVNDTAICYGDSAYIEANFTGVAPFTFVTSDGTNTQTYTGFNSHTMMDYVYPTDTTTYSIIEITDANGCYNGSPAADITVDIHPLPTVTILDDSVGNCLGSASMVNMDLTGQGPWNIYWEQTNHSDSTVTNVPATPYSYSALHATSGSSLKAIYKVEDDYGCTNYDQDTLQMVTFELPTLSIMSDTVHQCIDDSSQLNITLTGAAPFTVNISDGTNTMTENVGTHNWQPWVDEDAAGFKTYYITQVTDGNGCVGTNLDTLVVETWDLPTVDFTGLDAEYCNAPINDTLTGIPAGGTFSGPGITNDYFDPGAVSGGGTYNITYTYTDVNGCMNSKTISTIVRDLPTVSFTGLNTDYCVDAATATLTPSPTGGTFTGAGISGNVFDPAIAGTGTHDITYTYTDANGCTNTDVQTVTVNALPVISISGISSAGYCTNVAPVTITGTPSGGTFSGTGIDAAGVFDPATAGAGVHTITYTYSDANSCVNSTTADITVHALPAVNIGINAEYCLNAAYDTLTPSPAGGTFIGLGMAGDVFKPALAGTGTHTITYMVTDANGCFQTKDTTVTINPAPTANFSGLAATYCDNDSAAVTLSGTPTGGTFTGTGISGSDFTPALAGTGIHQITYTFTNSYGCTDSRTRSTEILPAPSVSMSGLAMSYCANDAPDTLAGLPVNGVFSGPGITGMVFDPAMAGAGNHTVVYTYTAMNGCDATASESTVVYPEPVVDMTGLSPEHCITDAAEMLSGVPAGGIFTGAGVYGSEFYSDSVQAGYNIVTYTYVDANGCAGMDMDTTMVYEMPMPDLGTDTAICAGDSILLNAGTIGTDFLWSTGDTIPLIFASPMINTQYAVMVTNGACQAEDSVMVSVSEPVADLGPDTTICHNLSLMLDAGAGYDAYIWSTGETTQSITVDSLSMGLGTHMITVVVTDSLGCTATDTITVTIDDCTGIHEFSSNVDVNIYPNPTDGIFTVEIKGLEDERMEMCIYNFNGQRILCEEIERNFRNGFVKQYDLSTQPQGVYLIKLTGKTMQKVKRIIIH